MLNLIVNPRMTVFIVFIKSFSGVAFKKRSAFLNNPIPAGFTVLKLGKNLICTKVYYNFAVGDMANM